MFVDSFVLYHQYFVINWCVNNWSKLAESGTLLALVKLTVLVTNCIVQYFFLVQFAKSTALACTLLLLFSRIVRTRFEQINMTLDLYSLVNIVKRQDSMKKWPRVAMIPWYVMAVLLRLHTKTFTFTDKNKGETIVETRQNIMHSFSLGNYELLVSTYLVTIVPLNVFLFVAAFSGIFSRIASSIYLPICVTQLITFLALHYVCGGYSSHIHSIGTRLITLYGRIRFPNVKQRLSVSNYIMKFYTRNLYGFNYTTIGLMTMAGFFKFILLYGEFVMYTFTTLNHQKMQQHKH